MEQLALRLLSRELHPFLSRWHPELARWEAENPEVDESEWPDNQKCRAELADLQERVSEYAMGFARLSGTPELMARQILGREDLNVSHPPVSSDRTSAALPSAGEA